LIITLLLAGALSVTQVKDTVWWTTPGGEVTQHRDDTDESCSLMLYDDDGSVVFKWNRPDQTFVTAIDWSWQFPNDWTVPVAIQLGDTWLSNGGDSAIIQAVAHGNAVSFSVNQPVDDLLRPADHAVIRTTSSELSIKLNRAKVGVLISRARLCREAITK
jgi:hypothetical protein